MGHGRSPHASRFRHSGPAAAGPTPQPAVGGTINFDLPGLPAEAGSAAGGPTPWLPVPAPRAVTPPPSLPPGLIATSVVPDIEPISAAPTSAPGVRETSMPTPATDTPSVETPQEVGGRLGTSGMPVNPDDPLGKKYEAAEPDTLIREIIKDAQGVKVPPPRAAPPDRATAPPQAKNPGPGKKKAVPPPPAEQSAEVSKPAWFKQAVAEEARLTADPEKKKSAPVGAVAADPRKSGPKAAARSVAAADWRKTETGTGGGGRGKLIAASWPG